VGGLLRLLCLVGVLVCSCSKPAPETAFVRTAEQESFLLQLSSEFVAGFDAEAAKDLAFQLCATSPEKSLIWDFSFVEFRGRRFESLQIWFGSERGGGRPVWLTLWSEYGPIRKTIDTEGTQALKATVHPVADARAGR
jgi:hypothetical protein